MAVERIPIPDFGGDSAEVTEILVAVGDDIATGQPLVVLETDKASVEVPSPAAGVLRSLAIATGASVAVGDLLGEIEVADGADAGAAEAAAAGAADAGAKKQQGAEPQRLELAVPDMGDGEAEVIELCASVGERLGQGAPLAVVETDKASVDIPLELAGELLELHIKVGDRVRSGAPLGAVLAVAAPAEAPAPAPARPSAPPPAAATPPPPAPAPEPQGGPGARVYAGPAVRKLARQLGVDLARVRGTGVRGYILKDDLHGHIRQRLADGGSGGIPAVPDTDFGAFGEVELRKMTRMERAIAANMSRNWLNIPHVTQFEDADITLMEEYRQSLKAQAKKRGVKMTPVPFLLRAIARAMLANPSFNVSLHSDGMRLVQRKFVHLGMAVATDGGLVVPVIRDVDKKDIWQLAAEVAEAAGRARDGKLAPDEMRGGCMTLSSLGALGGTGFTPIVNAPEVAILGVSRAAVRPHWDGAQFVPRTLLPLSLSYDHRAINGADAGGFIHDLCALLATPDAL